MYPDFYKLMLVTQVETRSMPEYLDFIKKCIDSGVSSVQLREKKASPAFKLDFALKLKKILSPAQIPLIINDDLALALEVDAEGLHLGQTDGSPQEARMKLGPDKILGLSIESEEELQKANRLDLNYVAASAVFPSRTKTNLKKIWGLEGLQLLSQQTKHPLMGIGGINEHNVSELMQRGAQGVALIEALHQAENPAKTALTIRQLIDLWSPL